jgi:hypothetical protein
MHDLSLKNERFLLLKALLYIIILPFTSEKIVPVNFLTIAKDMAAELKNHTDAEIDPPSMLLDILEAGLLYRRYGCEVHSHMRPDQAVVIASINQAKKSQTIGDYFSQYHALFYTLSDEDFIYILHNRPRVIAHISALYCQEDTFAVKAFAQFACHQATLSRTEGKKGIDIIQKTPDLTVQITKLFAFKPDNAFIRVLYEWLVAYPLMLSDASLWQQLLGEQIEMIRYLSILADRHEDLGLWSQLGHFSEANPEPLQRWILVHRGYLSRVHAFKLTWLDAYLEKIAMFTPADLPNLSVPLHHLSVPSPAAKR